MNEDMLLEQVKERDREDLKETTGEDYEEETSMPEVTCPKCGELVIPERVKFIKRSKQIQIKCPECKEFTIIPKDEHYDKMIQYLLDTGEITPEDLESKKKGKRKTRDIEDNLSDELEEEFDEYRILEEILEEEDKIPKVAKKHILDWMKLKPLEPHEIYTLLPGFGSKDTIAKRVSTDHAYALEKERIKRERFKNAIDSVFGKYKSIDIPGIDKTDITRPMVMKDRSHLDDLYTRPRLYDYYEPRLRRDFDPYYYRPPAPSPTLGGYGQEGLLRYLIDKLIDRVESKTGKSGELEELRKKLEDLEKQMLLKEMEKHLAERDKEIQELKSMIADLYKELSFSGKPESVQMLEIKKDALDNMMSRLENALIHFTDFLRWQTAVSKGIIPPETLYSFEPASDTDIERAKERLRKAIGKKNI
jgi:hypothetical protein